MTRLFYTFVTGLALALPVNAMQQCPDKPGFRYSLERAYSQGTKGAAQVWFIPLKVASTSSPDIERAFRLLNIRESLNNLVNSNYRHRVDPRFYCTLSRADDFFPGNLDCQWLHPANGLKSKYFNPQTKRIDGGIMVPDKNGNLITIKEGSNSKVLRIAACAHWRYYTFSLGDIYGADSGRRLPFLMYVMHSEPILVEKEAPVPDL